ncbi:T9SS type A sorting domain-containing protein [Bacteroides sp.]
MRTFFSFLLLFVGIVSAIAQQTTLSEERNEVRSDKLEKQQLDYHFQGPSGPKVIWNFHQLESSGKPYQLRYYVDESDTTGFIGVEHNTAYHYRKTGDSILLVKYANRTLSLNYSEPEVRLKYPFHYGDSVQSHFEGTGYYSHSIPMKLSGESVVKADGWGMLVIPGGDTLRQVLRVNTLRECKLVAGMDSSEIAYDCYSWYARGYRYPILETIHTTLNRDNKKHFAVTFFYPPESHKYELDEDPVNNAELESMLLAYEINPAIDSLGTAGWRDMNGDFLPEDYFKQDDSTVSKNEFIPEDLIDICGYIECYPSPVKDILTIKYGLKESATVGFQIFDSASKLLLLQPERNETVGDHQTTFNLSGYMPGVYHLHCLVNGREIKKTFIKSH